MAFIKRFLEYLMKGLSGLDNKKFLHILIFIAPLIAGWFALFIGAYGVSPFMVLNILFGNLFNGLALLPSLPDIPERAIILDIRLPRVVLAGLVGIAISGSGVTLQGIFRNPLVDPFILGISAGAAFGCAVSVGFLPDLPIQIAAFVCAILAVLLAYSIAKTQGEASRLPLILSGVIISAFFTALVSIVKFLIDPNKLQSIVFWLMESFSLSDWRLVKISAIGIGVSLLPIIFMRWRLNVMSMGEEEAKTLGI